MKTDTDFECPWCADTMTSVDVPDWTAGHAFACPTCSIVVELAPDPEMPRVARAA